MILILEALAKSGEPQTATELNQSLGLPKQSIHRLCATLEDEGYLAREEGDRRYRPGRRLRNLAVGLITASRDHIARHQVLMDIAAQVRETVNFVVPEETGMSYQDRVETDWPFRIQLPVGSNVPFHCTASGKTFLASLPPKARKRFVSALTLPRLTDRTHTDPDALLEDLARVAKQGYALDREEFMDGMVAIAVPVRDARGRFAAALAYHGPVQRMNLDDAVKRKEVLISGSERLTAALYD